MLGLVLLAAALSAPEIELAPDQPLPYIFGDEPLIIQLSDSVPGTLNLTLAYVSPNEPPITRQLSAIEVLPGRPTWVSTQLEPLRYGPHAIAILSGPSEFTFEISRIRRPSLTDSPPFVLHIPNRDGPWVQIARVLPAKTVSIDASHPGLDRLLADFARDGVRVRLALALAESPDVLAALPEEAPIVTVALPYPGSPDAWMHLANATQRHRPAARIALRSTSPDALVAILRAGGAELLDEIEVNDAESLHRHRAAAESQGYEGLRYGLHAEAEPIDFTTLLSAWNDGAVFAGYDADQLYIDGALTPDFARANALLHILDHCAPAGAYRGAVVFRNLSPSAERAWVAWLPSTNAAGGLGYEGVFDDFGNGAAEADEIAAARYAHGATPKTIARALARQIRLEANNLAGNPAVVRSLPGTIAISLHTLGEVNGKTSLRSEFFALLRALPVLEEAWHSGQLRKSAALPAIACIERTVRRIAALEQVLNVPFVEPLEETLDRCAQQQTLYLTGTGGNGASRERGEWLLQKVSELMEEARLIRERGRTIEGDAIAALAEWRARSLIHAAKAKPLTEVEPDPEPKVLETDGETP